MSPFSAGTVRTSPRAVNAARLPFGERAGEASFLSTFTKRGRTSGRSPESRTGTCVERPVPGSKRKIEPNCS